MRGVTVGIGIVISVGPDTDATLDISFRNDFLTRHGVGFTYSSELCKISLAGGLTTSKMVRILYTNHVSSRIWRCWKFLFRLDVPTVSTRPPSTHDSGQRQG